MVEFELGRPGSNRGNERLPGHSHAFVLPVVDGEEPGSTNTGPTRGAARVLCTTYHLASFPRERFPRKRKRRYLSVSLTKSPFDHMRTVVTLYNRLADDPQVEEALLGLADSIERSLPLSTPSS